MNPYSVECQREGTRIYYKIHSRKKNSLTADATKFLLHKTLENCSPNTVKRYAFSLSYYLYYLQRTKTTPEKVFQMPYDKQHMHFTGFLQWLRAGNHVSENQRKSRNNATCNDYLRDVFGWYQFLELLEEEEPRNLKVLSRRKITISNRIGLFFSTAKKTFKGYLPEDEQIGRTIERDQILVLLQNCTNVRDQLLLLLLSETGFRIGEMLGIRYTTDIDYQQHTMYIRFRENLNGARAKYAEQRHAKLSENTFDVLMFYLSEYRTILKNTDYLFVILSGKYRGSPMKVTTVYAMLMRLERKTGIKATPHMLRHYFANERKRDGWDLFLISKALGHRRLDTTERYLEVDNEELIRAAEEYYQKHKNLLFVDQLL